MSRVIQVALRWPTNWPRTPHHDSANFSGDRSLSRSVRALYDEVSRVKGVISQSIVITCGDARDPDPGAAVYFSSHAAGPLVLACDKWKLTAHNVWALACHVKAIRGQERWGVGTAKQQWSGFAQLPPSPDAVQCFAVKTNGKHDYIVSLADANLLVCRMCGDRAPNPSVRTHNGRKTWRSVLGFPPNSKPSADDVTAAHSNLIRMYHPDVGGSNEAAAEINHARDAALQAIGEV